MNLKKLLCVGLVVVSCSMIGMSDFDRRNRRTYGLERAVFIEKSVSQTKEILAWKGNKISKSDYEAILAECRAYIQGNQNVPALKFLTSILKEIEALIDQKMRELGMQ